MQYPNNYIRSNSPYRWSGLGAYYKYAGIGGGRLGLFTAGIQKRTSTPDGYGMLAGVMQPVKAGGVSAFNRSVSALTFTANLLQGAPMAGSGSWTIQGNNKTLSLIIGLAGTSTITIQGDGMVLALTIGLSGTGTWTLEGNNNSLALIVPFEGLGTFGITGIADLRGRLSMEGEWTPFTELSPENLARAVWSATASQYMDEDTTGRKLNEAGSAGDPWGTALPGTYAEGTAGAFMYDLIRLTGHKVTKAGNIITIYEADGETVWREYDLSGGGRVEQ